MTDHSSSFVLQPEVTDTETRAAAVRRARERGIVLPTFAQLAGDEPIPAEISEKLASVDPDAPDAANLWRIHWYNDADRTSRTDIPKHIVLTKELTGVDAPIVVMLGENFPMIGAHKVLPAYGCLVTQLVTGSFNPETHRAVWPSTGNYCRGGVAVSRTLGCAGVAVLPEGMSRERFEWLENWVSHPDDIIRTFGTESNVKEIYDKCNELEQDPDNVILNQFSAFSNYMVHYNCTGKALGKLVGRMNEGDQAMRATAFVSATGSAGTIAAGDYLKKTYGTRIAAVEALECPTMLENGYGEHNIQGIGDKHIPLIQNVLNTDFVIGVSDEVTDRLNVIFNSDETKPRLAQLLGISPATVDALKSFGISSLANITAAIRLAKYMNYGPDEMILTVATDSALLYVTEYEAARKRDFCPDISDDEILRTMNDQFRAADDYNVLETTARDRRRLFNLAYYTWVEQQGVELDDFNARKDAGFWADIANSMDAWDAQIRAFNKDVGL